MKDPFKMSLQETAVVQCPPPNHPLKGKHLIFRADGWYRIWFVLKVQGL